MRAIFLLNIVPTAVSLGGCANDAVWQNSHQASEIVVGNPTAHDDDLPAWVKIRSLSWAGSGCPAGSVAKNLAPDFTAFTLSFDSYVAEIGPGLPLSQSRRNCQILVDLDFPQGWSYSLLDVDYRGFANVEPGVSGVQQSAYYFQGESLTGRLQSKLEGPKVSDYQIHDSLALDAEVWSPCGAQRALNINSAVWVVNTSGNPNAMGVMTTDSIDGKVTHLYGLQWRRCPP